MEVVVMGGGGLRLCWGGCKAVAEQVQLLPQVKSLGSHALLPGTSEPLKRLLEGLNLSLCPVLLANTPRSALGVGCLWTPHSRPHKSYRVSAHQETQPTRRAISSGRDSAALQAFPLPLPSLRAYSYGPSGGDWGALTLAGAADASPGG